MALHGNLQVNGVTIGLYSIRRLNRLHNWAGWYYYNWEYARTSNLAKRYTGTVSHRYNDGAERLVEKVMADIRITFSLDLKSSLTLS